MSTSQTLHYGYELFSKSIPLPPPWPEHPPKPAPAATLTPYDWKPSSANEIHRDAIEQLQLLLRLMFKRKLSWPSPSSYAIQTPQEYATMLLEQVATLFNQLHVRSVFDTPMKTIEIDCEDAAVYAATFAADDFDTTCPKIVPPIILCLPDDLFDVNNHLTPRLAHALFTALHNHPTIPALIVSNLTSITIFHHSESNTYERIQTTNTSFALRALIAAYLLRSLPPNHAYLTYADASELYHEHIPRIGPPQNPSLPVQPDDELFAQCQRHSDFDFVTLAHDRARALQFFRWQEHMRRSANEKGSGKIVVHPHDLLCASSARPNLISMTPGWDVRPSYPYDEAQLPAETLAHLEAIQRPSPLADAGCLDKALEKSAVFEIMVDRVISEGSKWGLSTVYLCHITSVDGEPIPSSSTSSSPQLCLKLYDDRFQRLCPPDENDPLYHAADQPRWFDGVAVAEEVALCEARAYLKMRAVWGAVVPWFYGLHEFTLPDGMKLCGILMEYIPGGDLRSPWAKELNEERQSQLIKSCRHAARVLDASDINQRDFKPGQIMIHITHPLSPDSRPITHAILISFAHTTQTLFPPPFVSLSPSVLPTPPTQSPPSPTSFLSAPTPQTPNYTTPPHPTNYLGNYTALLGVLLHWAHEARYDTRRVWEGFGEPDKWDAVDLFGKQEAGVEGVRVRARGLFGYILDG